MTTDQSQTFGDTAPVISVRHWLLTLIVLAIPILNLVMLFVWAFGDGANPNKRNYSRAALLLSAIALALYLIFLLVFVVLFSAAFGS
ncbi:hypothetical protein SAMN02799630_05098 [Paenibacillus sp. UNCCL117]|uniref:hypothetical protein n=1 Tax=unclassified Paenibacillus TaxID=185978 RepID=UPI00087FBC57|nr:MULTISPECIES: hypothetical protein [unclassified Paenibacillus]SDE30010.1 hypothetical protein SAMN04488602_12459 [Paenibacillus sp. cl123]SFW63150.1 hypothetical protein SAMN02799630_05098 [Paenibacillus sp. UNCCL117]